MDAPRAPRPADVLLATGGILAAASATDAERSVTSAASGATGGWSERKKSSQATARIMISQPQITSQR